jgi:hypothetical protein
VPVNDRQIQKAAAFVRQNYQKSRARKTPPPPKSKEFDRTFGFQDQSFDTYELSLALLFLDRLGEKQDRKIIRSIALRLIAGQTSDAGWTYALPKLTPEQENKLEKFLDQTRPADLERFVPLPERGNPDKVVQVPAERGQLERGVQGDRPQKDKPGLSVIVPDKKPEQPGGATLPGPDAPVGLPPKEEAGKQEPRKPLTEAQIRRAIEQLPPRLQKVPAVADALGRQKFILHEPFIRGSSDNSNTQFAILALWVARRHGLPVERTLRLTAQRFRTTQRYNGAWGYFAAESKTSLGYPAMTGVGLLGLAVGLGVRTQKDPKENGEEEQIRKGIQALSERIGKASPDSGRRRFIALYLLWTVERVGVLYGKRKLGDKDWYAWGVDELLPTQQADGSWNDGFYLGASRTLDTCLALLFLKRSNLTADLTKKLEATGLPKKLEFVIKGKVASPGR